MGVIPKQLVMVTTGKGAGGTAERELWASTRQGQLGAWGHRDPPNHTTEAVPRRRSCVSRTPCKIFQNGDELTLTLPLGGSSTLPSGKPSPAQEEAPGAHVVTAPPGVARAPGPQGGRAGTALGAFAFCSQKTGTERTNKDSHYKRKAELSHEQLRQILAHLSRRPDLGASVLGGTDRHCTPPGVS